MKKLIYLITALLTVISCDNSQPNDNPELNEFISKLDDKSIEEIKEEMNSNVKQFESISKFFENSFSNEIEVIVKEDEKYEEAFKIDTTGISKALYQFNDIVFVQTFEDYESQLEFTKNNSDSSKPINLGEGVSQKFIPNKIYYHDGEIRTDSIADYEVDFTFDEAWGKVKPIDSIDITYNLNYVKDYDVVEVSLDKPKVTFKGGEITLVKAEGNYIYFTLSDTIDSPVRIQGYNAEGKVLDRSGYSNNGIAPGEMKSVFTEMLGYFKKLQEKLNDDDFENTAEFQEYLKNNLSNLDFFNDNDGIFHRQYYYHGNVKSIKLYFENDSENRETLFTARNYKPFKETDDLFAMETEDATVFLNSKGEPQITIKGSDGLENTGGNFYEDYNYFYYLNRAEKRLDTLLVYDVKVFNNGLVGILPEQENEHYTLFTSDNKPIGSKSYWLMREVGDLLFGITDDDKYYILDENANATLLTGVTKISDNLSDDRIIVSNANSKIGFMNSKGKMVIPFKYSDAEDFEDGITAVQFNGTYKFIDLNGKVLFDTKEDDIDFLKKDDQEKRIYSFDYGKTSYNYKGELIKK
ncbi:WG repeat-containing protein [Aureibaculum sp. A20]|uniref:WG repeat-containing protein n=1 Tax=Aureibaculum flavum TaxID=2795986 RepID=A0ABS0WS61_9FLAO|nr:WG repeat-containing protein [Aureibaculum flavum]MBJ2174818.1 WG repeat-containing protein [Aureibaculum flavum]